MIYYSSSLFSFIFFISSFFSDFISSFHLFIINFWFLIFLSLYFFHLLLFSYPSNPVRLRYHRQKNNKNCPNFDNLSRRNRIPHNLFWSQHKSLKFYACKVVSLSQGNASTTIIVVTVFFYFFLLFPYIFFLIRSSIAHKSDALEPNAVGHKIEWGKKTKRKK